MEAELLKRVSPHVAFWALAFCVVGYLVGGEATLMSAGIGGLVSLINWQLIRAVMTRVAKVSDARRTWMLLGLLAKSFVLVGILWTLVTRLHLDIVGLALGLGAFVIGLCAAAIQAHLNQSNELVPETGALPVPPPSAAEATQAEGL